jgi:purine nucleosidase
MPRKVILDVDPGIDDAVATIMALFDPRLEVMAITAVAGGVPADQATRNVQALVEQLDPPRWPRIGAAVEPERAPAIDCRNLYGADGLGNAHFQVAELHNRHPSEKVLTDEIRSAPDSVTIITMGPLTNVAQALRRDPALASQIGQIIILGGAVKAPGNATAAAEFNMYYDPVSARDVFRARITKTLVPLDVTTQIVFNYEHLGQLPNDETKVGKLLRHMLPFAFRSHRQALGLEGMHLHAAVAMVAATNPELFTTQQWGGDVETLGELTTGATVFDRRLLAEWRGNMDVAVEADAAGVIDSIMRGLSFAAR